MGVREETNVLESSHGKPGGGGELEWKEGTPSSQDREHPGQPLVSHLQLLGMLTHLRTEETMEEYPV